MEKIQSIEQLDALGVKICEILQVGIDKANIVVPETLQQLVAWVLWGNAIESIICVLLGIASFIMAKRTFGVLIKELDTVEDFAVVMMRGVFLAVNVLCCSISFLQLVMYSLPALIKAIFAPNLVIIEQLGGLLK